jgi:hypothetical protein
MRTTTDRTSRSRGHIWRRACPCSCLLIAAASGCVPECPEYYESIDGEGVNELVITVTSEGFMEDWELHAEPSLALDPGDDSSMSLSLANPDCTTARIAIGFRIGSDGALEMADMMYMYRQCSIDPTLQEYVYPASIDVECPVTVTPTMEGGAVTRLSWSFDGCSLRILDVPPAGGPLVGAVTVNGSFEARMERLHCK